MRNKRHFKTFLIFSVLCLLSINSYPAHGASAISPGSSLSNLEMSMPDSQESRKYLCIQDAEVFKLSNIPAKLVIVEFFSTFCKVCQAQASVANRLYKLIEGDPELKKDIKMIGIGVGNQPKTIAAYSKALNVSFPLIADPGGKILNDFKIELIPQTLLVDKDAKVLTNHKGVIEDLDNYLQEIRNQLKQQ